MTPLRRINVVDTATHDVIAHHVRRNAGLPFDEDLNQGGRNQASTRPSNNLYNSGANRDRVAPSNMQRDAGLQKADRVGKGGNNVYGDRNGNVQRQNSKGNWQSRENGQWKNSTGNRSSDLGRDSRARQSGNRSWGGGSRGGGGRGCGGRGR